MADGFGFRMDYCVNFENATAEYLMPRDEPLVVYQDGEATPVAFDEPDGYYAELAYMVECIEAGKAPSIVTPADALESLMIVEAECRSVETGETVRL